MSVTKIAKKVPFILGQLEKTYPHAYCELNYHTPFQLLIATMLSAQTTDAKVNQVTLDLFRKHPTPEEMLKLTTLELENYIRSIGLFRTKAKNILETCEILLTEFLGQVPQTMEALTRLPGVGKKTASVVLGNAFDIPAFPVDTHVGRVARRLGLTKEIDPDKVAKDLTSLIPEDLWIDTHHRFIFHGRYCCTSRKPQCDVCPLIPFCNEVHSSPT